MEICTKFPTTRKNIHIQAYFARLGTLWDSLTLHPKTQKRMKNVIKREQCKLACGLPSVNILSKVSKFKVLLYLKKSNLDKQGKAPIMGRITLNRSNLFACQSKNSMAQFSRKQNRPIRRFSTNKVLSVQNCWRATSTAPFSGSCM